MRLLDKYILREFLVPFVYCLAGFLVFWISFNLFSQIGEFQEHHLRFLDILEYYFTISPSLLVEVLPIVLLLALLYSLTNHARHNELTAIRAAGIGTWRFALPYFAVALLLVGGVYILNEVFVPRTVDLAEDILRRRESTSALKDLHRWHKNVIFNFPQQNGDRRWIIDLYNDRDFQMVHPEINWIDASGVHHELSAGTGIYTNGAWTFLNVIEFKWTAGNEALPARSSTNIVVETEFGETPELIRSEIKIGSLTSVQALKRPQLSVRDILSYLSLHPELPTRQKSLLLTQLHGRLAEPWKALAVVLIALPFGAASGRRNVFVGVASAIFICFAYFIIQRLCLAGGTAGHMPAWVAAWTPNLAFGCLGLILNWRLR
ncbi:MAG: lipopolysaccharide transporter permease LptF [Verrucomicrobiales bacterium]|nr:lipopolysaccharide transporter permease LptF [Verrucomicrobiales bacterium]MDB6130221.1 lipopolysaccharide transporter permease LptF [Verrucomicrobiales bacterium]